jgi:Ca-activated chloride channel family protein
MIARSLAPLRLAAAALSLSLSPLALAQSCPEGKDPAKIELNFGAGSMSAAFSQGVLLEGSDGELYLSIEFATKKAKSSTRPPLNLSIVIDRSGSMSGDKIESAKEAASGLIENLGPSDRVSLVQYDHQAQVLVPSTLADEKGKSALMAALDGITPGGSTNLHDGMALGIEEVISKQDAGQASRVILLSDGRANSGIVDPSELALDASAAAERGIRVTTVGLGLDYNEDLMEDIAINGAGHYYYVKGAADLQPIFAGELSDLQDTVATRAELRLEPSCTDVEIIEVYGYRMKREGGAVVIPIPDLAGGDTRKVVLRVKANAARVSSGNVLKTSFAFDDRAGKRQESKGGLGLVISKDKKASVASVNKDVLAKATEIEAARALRDAATAYDKGDADQAQSTIKKAKEKASKQAKTYGFSDDLVQGSLKAAETDFAKPAPSAEHRKDAVKRNKANSNSAMY